MGLLLACGVSGGSRRARSTSLPCLRPQPCPHHRPAASAALQEQPPALAADGPALGAWRRAAGQEMLRMVRVYLNGAPRTASHVCIRNFAIWMNGTEVVHERWNNITTVNVTGNGTYEFGNNREVLDMSDGVGYGGCPTNGMYFL
jgi:hypothetical protein